MKRKIIYLLLVLLVGCSAQSPHAALKIVEPTSDVNVLYEPVDNQVAESLWKFSDQIKVLSTTENSVYSPTSLYGALSLLIPAAKGSTKDELLSFLHLSDASILTPFYKQLNVMNNDFANFMSNSIWLNHSIKDTIDNDIIEELKDVYLASSHLVDFENESETSKTITEFVKKQTNDFIDVTVRPDSQTDILLINTLYVKDKWLYPFSETTPIDFKDVGPVDSGVIVIERPRYYEDDDVQMVTKALSQYHSMLFVKPKHGLESLDSMLEIYDKLKNTEHNSGIEVVLKMPEVEVTSKYEGLKDLLENSGLSEILSDNPNLSYHNNDLMNRVTKIIQDAKIVVDREGVEAAAVTTVELEVTALPPEEVQTIEMTLDEPYVMILLSSEDIPLFITNIINPKE